MKSTLLKTSEYVEGVVTTIVLQKVFPTFWVSLYAVECHCVAVSMLTLRHACWFTLQGVMSHGLTATLTLIYLHCLHTRWNMEEVSPKR